MLTYCLVPCYQRQYSAMNLSSDKIHNVGAVSAQFWDVDAVACIQVDETIKEQRKLRKRLKEVCDLPFCAVLLITGLVYLV